MKKNSEVSGQKSEKRTTDYTNGTDKKSAELIAVKEEKAIDTEKARLIATWALGHHDGTRAGATLTVVSAIACGIQLNKAKELLPHGEFMKWCKKYLGSIDHRTATRYMALAVDLQTKLDTVPNLKPSKFATVANLLDIAPEHMTVEYARKVAPRVAKLVEGKSIKELYEEFGIIKPREACDREAQELVKKVEAQNPKNAKERQMLFAKEIFGDVIRHLNTFEKFVDTNGIDPDTQDDAVAKLKEMLEKLSGGKVEIKYQD